MRIPCCVGKATSPFLLIILAALFLAAQAIAVEIPLKKQGGVYSLPVRINGVITLDFILDSGASEVTIPADVALTLLRAGTISEKDFLPGQKFKLADGSILKGARFQIRELEVGGLKISNVPAVVAPITGSLLLGQSCLSRMTNWSIDNQRQLLIISEVRATKIPPTRSAKNPESDRTKILPTRNANIPQSVPVPKSEVNFFNGPGIPGLKWGDSPDKVKDMMDKCKAVNAPYGVLNADKRFIEAYETYTTRARSYGKYAMDYHGKFMNREGLATFIFYEQKLYNCRLLFDDSGLESYYFDLLGMLKAKYGPPDKTENKENSRQAQWHGDPTAVYLYQSILLSKSLAPCGPTYPQMCGNFTELELSDWKTRDIADERERQYKAELQK